MEIHVSAHGVVEVRDTHDFASLKVVARSLRDASAAGEVTKSGDHVYIEPQTVRELVGPQTGQDGWDESFAGMIVYAESKGWTDHEGRIRAHLEVSA